MNDNFPAASWACVDWYGAPKIGHYIFQDAFAPLHACILAKTLNVRGTPVSFDVFLLDDADALHTASWGGSCRGVRKKPEKIKEKSFHGEGSIDAPMTLGKFTMKYWETDTCPLWVTTEVWKNGRLADRTFIGLILRGKGMPFPAPRRQH